MSLWDLMTILHLPAAIGGALSVARVARAGSGGLSLAIFVALVIGPAVAVCSRKIGNAVIERGLRDGSVSERSFWYAYGLVAAGVIAAGALGVLGTRLVLHLAAYDWAV